MEYCSVCGKRVSVGKNNCIQNDNGSYRHKKCPKTKEPTGDHSAYKKLKERIQYHFNENAKGALLQYGLNWYGITPKIKKLKEVGYSYEDQIYALDEVVKANDGFWGYGSVEKHISRIIYQRDKHEKIKEAIDRPPEEVKFTPKFDLQEATLDF